MDKETELRLAVARAEKFLETHGMTKSSFVQSLRDGGLSLDAALVKYTEEHGRLDKELDQANAQLREHLLRQG